MCTCVCTRVSLGALKDQKRTLDSSELDLQADVTCSIQVLGTLFGSPATAVHAANHRAISLTPCRLAFDNWIQTRVTGKGEPEKRNCFHQLCLWACLGGIFLINSGYGTNPSARGPGLSKKARSVSLGSSVSLCLLLKFLPWVPALASLDDGL